MHRPVRPMHREDCKSVIHSHLGPVKLMPLTHTIFLYLKASTYKLLCTELVTSSPIRRLRVSAGVSLSPTEYVKVVRLQVFGFASGYYNTPGLVGPRPQHTRVPRGSLSRRRGDAESRTPFHPRPCPGWPGVTPLDYLARRIPPVTR